MLLTKIAMTDQFASFKKEMNRICSLAHALTSSWKEIEEVLASSQKLSIAFKRHFKCCKNT